LGRLEGSEAGVRLSFRETSKVAQTVAIVSATSAIEVWRLGRLEGSEAGARLSIRETSEVAQTVAIASAISAIEVWRFSWVGWRGQRLEHG